jgi:hypothetical protein
MGRVGVTKFFFKASYWLIFFFLNQPIGSLDLINFSNLSNGPHHGPNELPSVYLITPREMTVRVPQVIGDVFKNSIIDYWLYPLI